MLIINSSKCISENNEEFLNLCIEYNLNKGYVQALKKIKNPKYFVCLKFLLDKFENQQKEEKEIIYALIEEVVEKINSDYIRDKYFTQKPKYISSLFDILVKNKNNFGNLIKHSFCVD